MRKTLAILVASTALTTAIGVPAWSAMRASTGDSSQAFSALFDDGTEAPSLVRVRDDDDHHAKHRKWWRLFGDDDDDDDDDDDHDDDDDDDDDGRRGGARNPAPAGTVAPPQNGLFGTGTPPKVQVN